jgi:type III secretion protein C
MMRNFFLLLLTASLGFAQETPRFFSLDEEPTPEAQNQRPARPNLFEFDTTPPSNIPPPPSFVITPEEIAEEEEKEEAPSEQESPDKEKTILINFTNVNMVELLRFISQISGRNFYYNDEDLQFNVSIVSEEPTTIENILTAVFQELRVHNLDIIEQGNNFIIHKNPKVNAISRVVGDSLKDIADARDTEIVTKVFRLNVLDPDKAATVVLPLVSEQAVVEVVKDPNHIIVTDLATNVNKISELLRNIDAPQSGQVIGQYVVRNMRVPSMIQIMQEIMTPIAQGQTVTFVPHTNADSIFVISSPYLVERSLAMMQYVDQTEGMTQIHDLSKVKGSPKGRWRLDENGNWVFVPEEDGQEGPPSGQWMLDANGNWVFVPDGQSLEGLTRPSTPPNGRWVQDADGKWNFKLNPGQSISPGRLDRKREIEELPVGDIERTQFFIHKLQYRKGEEIVNALGRIAESLQNCGTVNEDLICTINSGQWIESSNSVIFTGTIDALGRVKELIDEIDTPLRQVFIEMLILETDITDSLTYGVNWGSSFGGGNTSGSQAFLSTGSSLGQALDTSGVDTTPDATVATRLSGYTLGIIGQSLSRDGTTFRTLGALVRALHDKSNSKIVMNPKIIVEDQQEAEIFVGINTRFQTNSIANDRGSTITSNFEFRDIGTTLRITPSISNNDIITLDIYQESSNALGDTSGGGGAGTGGGGGVEAQNTTQSDVGPTTRLNKTITRVHVPNKYFLVISGMMQDTNTVTRTQIPCLGGIPILGALFSERERQDTRSNLMIFIRPEIIDTTTDIQNLTKHQQDIFKRGGQMKKSWKYGTEEALDFLNVPELCKPWCAEIDSPY